MRARSKILFVIPAAPGFYVLSPCFECEDDDGAACEALREPVVGWAVDAAGFTSPVTPIEVLNSDHDDPAILYPDGTVWSFDRNWKSESEWLAWINEQNQNVTRSD